MTEERFITRPSNSRIYHIFGKDHRSLCGRILMLTVNKVLCDVLTGKENYNKGQDCKACFKKAGLHIREEP